jgi:hypothetical protein
LLDGDDARVGDLEDRIDQVELHGGRCIDAETRLQALLVARGMLEAPDD